MTTTIAIANQKGGVGKTTIALALSTAISDLVRQPVLLIDLDTQANATVGLGQKVDRKKPGLADWLMMGRPLSGVVTHVRERLDLVPGSSMTEDVNLSLANRGKLDVIKRGLNGAGHDYKYVVLDCPPNLSMITRVGLYAAKYVLTPVDCEFFALQGLVTLAQIIQEMQEAGGRARWLGVIPNKYRSNVLLHQRSLALLREKFGRWGEKFVWDPLPLTIQIARTQEEGESLWACEDVDHRHRAVWAAMVKRVLRYG